MPNPEPLLHLPFQLLHKEVIVCFEQLASHQSKLKFNLFIVYIRGYRQKIAQQSSKSASNRYR